MRFRAWLAWPLVAIISLCSASNSELFVPAPPSTVDIDTVSIAGVESASEEVLSAARDALSTRRPPKWSDSTYNDRDSCWAVLSVWPERRCVKRQNWCPVKTIAQADSCTFCSRGYGVYRTEEDCLTAPEAEGEGEISVSSTPIDPFKYHQPEVAGTQCWKSRSTTNQDACPHLWPDVRLWEDAYTWPDGKVPFAWSAVTLPENTKVLISGCSLRHSEPFFSINIPSSSELIFADTPFHLRVGSIHVNGRMRIGSPSCRTQQPITITFEKLQGLNLFEMGIQVSKTGQLDMHGREFFPTWTRLSETAQQWTNSIKLSEPVNWQPGQLVTIATSIWRDEYENQNEVMRVSSVSYDGRTVTFDDAMRFSHYGGVEYKTEVALLSRSIVLRGHDRAQDEKKGGHVRIEGQGRIRGVLAYKMGQRNTRGAYPFHFHHLGFIESSSSFISDSAVYNSFYRGVVVHGTSGLLVKGNVAFHVDASCFYLEDGVEEYNWLEGNFAGFIHTIGPPAGGNDQTGSLHIQSEGLEQPADAAAAGFYSGNLNNVWLRNAASGGFAGFSFPTFPKPIQDFRWREDFVPLQRPLQRFEGNTVHSTGYFWLMAGGIYFGGSLWHNDNDGGKLYYSSGRFESDPKTEDGTQETTHVLKYNKAWLAQWGVSHWGDRVTVEGWEADDCTRGANLFGMANLKSARINGRSDNKDAQYPGRLTDLAPIAGFQWYDARVLTILSDVTFRNYFYQPQLGTSRQSVWHSMVHSDEFKPQHMSTSIGIRYENVDWRALVNHAAISTGGSRYFQWVDWDGSASKRWRPTVFGSWPSWWNAGDECTFQDEWNVWLCEWYPWRTPARLDIRVPGYTARVDTNSALPPTPENEAGYIAQFGYRYDKKRSVVFTRNEGSVGLTGKGGWYVHFKHGVTRKMTIFPNQVPPGTSLVFATRYPRGTTFNIRRWFKWKGKYTSDLRWTRSLQDVLDSPTGELFFFDGKHLYIKITDPDARVQRPLMLDGAIVWGARYFELKYEIEATNLDDSNCPWRQGARFCYMQEDESSDIPDFLPPYTSWLEPYCADVPPPGSASCHNQKSWGKCNDDFMTSPDDIEARALGSYCAVTCGRCTVGEFSCADRAPPGSLSNGKSCPQLKEDCACFQWWMEEGNFCAATCGFGKCEDKSSSPDGGCEDIVPPGGSSCEEQRCFGKCYDDWMYRGDYCQNTCGRCNECRDLVPNSGYSCAQHRDWGDCSKSWMKDGRLCEATCCVCSGCTLEPVCSDKPPGGESCWERKQWGSCAEPWMKDGGYCRETCGFDPCPPVCDDIEPGGGVACWQRKEWGNCADQWMRDGGYCKQTCGLDPCPPVCDDIQPDGGVACWQRKDWGNCDDQWMKDGGYCRRTCGFDPCAPVCSDNEPPGGVSCWQRREWGNCNDQWMKDGGYCARTCGFWPCPVCDDQQPPGDAQCWQRKQWGNCDNQWMKDGHYCARTCGYFPC